MPSILTTCCPTVNLLIEKYYPELTPLMAPVVSPALAHGRMLKKRLGPDTKVVFIGPCLSKIQEIREHGESADAVLSFRQLEILLKERDLMDEEGNLRAPAEAPDRDSPIPASTLYRREFCGMYGIHRARFGTLAEKGLSGSQDGYDFISVCGLENIRNFLEELRKGSCGRVFAELNSCEGGCVNGPLIPDGRRAAYHSRLLVERYAQKAPAFVSEQLSPGVDL